MKHSAEIEADMAAQLARVRKMERNGELKPIPEISATTLNEWRAGRDSTVRFAHLSNPRLRRR